LGMLMHAKGGVLHILYCILSMFILLCWLWLVQQQKGCSSQKRLICSILGSESACREARHDHGLGGACDFNSVMLVGNLLGSSHRHSHAYLAFESQGASCRDLLGAVRAPAEESLSRTCRSGGCYPVECFGAANGGLLACTSAGFHQMGQVSAGSGRGEMR